MNTNPPLAAEESESTIRSPERVKVTFILPKNEWEDLRVLANRRGDTVTDTLRRAIALEVLADKAKRTGSKLLVLDPDGTMKEILVR